MEPMPAPPSPPVFAASGDAGVSDSVSSQAAVQSYVDDMSLFMEEFSTLVTKACSECKPSSFGLSSPAAARIRQRPDRVALQQVYRHLHDLHTDALIHASASALPLFAAASMRLHQQLQLLVLAADGGDGGGGEADDDGPVLALVSSEDAAALRRLRGSCVAKPRGTVALALRQLRGALRRAAAAQQRMVEATLVAGGGGADVQLAAQARQLEESMGAQLEATLEATLQQAEAQRAGVMESHERRTAEAEEAARQLAEKLAALEANAEAAAEAVAARASGEVQAAQARLGREAEAVRAEAAHARGEAERAQHDAAQAREAAAAAQADAEAARREGEALRAEGGTLTRQTEELRASLASAEGAVHAMGAKVRELEGVAAAHAQLVAQAEARRQHAQQTAAQHVEHAQAVQQQQAQQQQAQLPPGAPQPQPQPQYVPHTVLLELQREAQMLDARYRQLAQQHGALQQLLRRREAELQAGGAHARGLQQQLEMLQARGQAGGGGSGGAVGAVDGGAGGPGQPQQPQAQPLSAMLQGVASVDPQDLAEQGLRKATQLFGSVKSGVKGLLSDFSSTIGADDKDDDKQAQRNRA